MNVTETLLLVLHVLVAAAICGFVLLQHGKGADMGAAFGSGSSGSLFGAAGSANFLSRTTAILATVFFLTSLGLTWYGSNRGATGGSVPQGVMERLPAGKAGEVPQAPVQTPPTTAPAQGTSPAPAAPSGGAGSKAGEVPK